MSIARRCKAERHVAKLRDIILLVPRLKRECNVVVVDRLVERKTWHAIAEENGIPVGATKRIFRSAITEIEKLLRWDGRLKRRRRPARNLKLKAR